MYNYITVTTAAFYQETPFWGKTRRKKGGKPDWSNTSDTGPESTKYFRFLIGELANVISEYGYYLIEYLANARLQFLS